MAFVNGPEGAGWFEEQLAIAREMLAVSRETLHIHRRYAAGDVGRLRADLARLQALNQHKRALLERSRALRARWEEAEAEPPPRHLAELVHVIEQQEAVAEEVRQLSAAAPRVS